MNVLEVLGRSGDIKVEWDPNDEESVAQARAEFDALKSGQGMAIMKILPDGSTERADEFDPAIGRYVGIPQLVGG